MIKIRKPVHHAGGRSNAALRAIDLARVGNRGPRFGAAVSFAVIGAAIALVTFVIVLVGGAPTPLAHLYYVPILYSATRHGHRGALAAALASGLAVGPWMPAPNIASGVQSVNDWGVRLVLFVAVGLVASWLASQDARPFDVLLRDIVLGQGLRSAVRNGRVRVHYQPLVDLSDGRVLGVEALCRWSDSRGRAVAPDVFIPAAEHTGAIMMVGREVLRLSTEQSVRWADEHGDGLTMSVNVSAVQLGRPGFLDDLTRLAGEAASRRFRLCIEITETAIIADRANALAALSAARDMGVCIALDDFGTGQSSLAYLAGFPIDVVKIDQSFVEGVDVDATSRALVGAIVHIASSLGAITIAEGIERPEQLRVLRSLGCDIGQGYYLGRPTDAADVDWTARPLA